MKTREDAAAIAVIGVAFELPGCPDWAALTTLLRHGRDAMHRFPDERAEATGVARSATDRDGGWIDDITGFDYRYFGLAKAEAELIDPRQRRMLQLACRTIGHAGYAPAELAGTNTAVLVGGYGAPHPSLSDLLPAEERHSGQAKTGSLHAYAAGRIAYHLDLRGAAQVVDTACSSFLVALHEARWKLARGESDLALVGGYELVLGALPQRSADGMGVLSPVDRCRPFDASADGTTYGEGGGFVLLKPLDAALRDGDTVHAILRGSAVNQDARRGAGLTAPSPQAQTEVITAALRDAEITAAAIGYVEAHGTGTKIGDPIEIQGLLDAYAGQLDGAGPAVSSIKANVGHLGSMAAFAGLVRILAQFRAGEIFPTAHLEQPNPLLDIDGAPLHIADRVEPWTGDTRYAAISSFGLSGTNAHMIVQAPEPTESASATSAGTQVVVLSARNSAGLRAQVQALHDQIAADPSSFDLNTAAAVLSVGREHFAHRHAWLVHDAKDLLEQLADTLTAPSGNQQGPPDPTPVVVALGDITDAPVDQLQATADAFPAFARIVASAKAHMAETDWTPTQRGLIWLIGTHQVLTDAGIKPDLLLTHGIGATAARVAGGDEDLPTALSAEIVAPRPPRADALTKAMSSLPANPVIIDPAPGTELSTLLTDHPSTAVASTPADALRHLYLAGHQLNWRGALGQSLHRRLELPVAPMAEVHCWPTVATPATPTVGATSAGAPSNAATPPTATPLPTTAPPSTFAASVNSATSKAASPTIGPASTSDAMYTDDAPSIGTAPLAVGATSAAPSTATPASSAASPVIGTVADDASFTDTAPKRVPTTTAAPSTNTATTTASDASQHSALSVAKVVIALAREVLKEPGLQPEDDFFDVGGTSLNGAQWVARINERFGTDLGVLDLYDYQDLGETAAAVAELVDEGPSTPSTTVSATSTDTTPTATTPPAGSEMPTTAPLSTDDSPLAAESLNGRSGSTSGTTLAGATPPATIAGAQTALHANAELVGEAPSTTTLSGTALVADGTTHIDNPPLADGTSHDAAADASTALQPHHSVAEIVIELARLVLKEPGLQAEDDFFDVGGTSLNGAQWVARINERFGTDLGVLDLYDYQDLGETAAAVAELVGETPSAAPLADESRNGGAGSASGATLTGATSPATSVDALTALHPAHSVAELIDETLSTATLTGGTTIAGGDAAHPGSTPRAETDNAPTAIHPTPSIGEAVGETSSATTQDDANATQDLPATALDGSTATSRGQAHDEPDTTIDPLTAAYDGRTHDGPTAVSSAGGSRADEGPLSGQQLAIWAADRLDPDTGAYNVPAALLVDGKVDIAALTERLRVVVARHPMLRARIVDTVDGPRQVVTPVDEAQVQLTERVVDLTGVAAAEGRAELLDRLREVVAEPLSPYGPSSRYLLVRAKFRDGEQQVLLPIFHHLFVDGWSWGLLFAELGGDPSALPAPERRYVDYVADQQARLDGPAGTDLTDFWSGYLSGASYVPLPTDQVTSEMSDGTSELALPIDSARATRLRELARRERCSLNTVLLAAWMTMLRQITGEQDVCVAFPAAGRKPIDEPVVGNYATTLVVRTTVQPEQSITALLTAVRTASLRALDHQDLPTDRLRRLARPNSADPLASTMFTVTSDVEPLRRLGSDGPAVELLDVGQGGAAFPIAVTVLEYGSQLRCRLQYDPTMFRASTIRAWADAYQALLDRLTSLAPDTPVHTLSIGIAPTPRRRPTQVNTTKTAAALAAPNTALQQRLCALWSHYLHRDRIGIDDDFFDLGGDSISAIAIAADAGTNGIALRPRYILQLRTIAAVAATIAERESIRAETDSGATPPLQPDEHTAADPTPPQLEFLARGVPTPDHWNHGVRYTLRHHTDTETVERSVRDLAHRHPALRAQLRTVDDKWQLLPDGALPEVTEFDLTTADPADLPNLVHNTATELHRTLSLSDGPVCRAGVFRTPAGHDDRLVLVIHHTMVDLYSWNVVTEDLSSLLDGTSTAELPPPSSSYFDWARRLANLVRTNPDSFDASYWLDRSWGDATQLRLADHESFGVEGNTGELFTEFPAPDQIPGLSRAEQLLATLGAALQQWLDVRGGEIAIQLVGHGREDLFDDLDLGRTVGYFNTTYPFALGLPGRRTPADHTAFVAEQLRSIPGRGFDFEPLRRFHPDAAIRAALDQVGTPAVQFSFWGTPEFLSAEEDPTKALTNADNDLVGQDRPDDMPRPCAIEVYPMLVADQVRVQWRYSGELFTPERILALAEAFGAASATPAPMIHQETGVTR
ncbi:condensation domain-containing protein [Nocardia colli]|uniref:condensation domain-containing protein n=1 Tax=Nocardia colli TaxID=2545717 RepID=UPI0035E24D40